MSVDLLGGVFNDLSLAFKEDFDVVAGVTYTLVVVRHSAVFITRVTAVDKVAGVGVGWGRRHLCNDPESEGKTASQARSRCECWRPGECD